jgi:hypothetical protein
MVDVKYFGALKDLVAKVQQGFGRLEPELKLFSRSVILEGKLVKDHVLDELLA